MKKFIKTENDKVTFIHYLPFDEKNGMGKTEEELLKEGYLVDEIPEAEQIDGKIPILYYTKEKDFWYEYIDTLSKELYTLDEAATILAQEVSAE